MSRENLLDKVTSRAEENEGTFLVDQDIPGPVQGAWVSGLVRELDPRWHKQKSFWDAAKKMLQWQQRSKVLCATTKF